MIARSTEVSAFRIDGYVLSPWILSCFGFTGSTFPSNPPSIRFSMRVLPMLPFFSLAPITVMESGLKNLSKF